MPKVFIIESLRRSVDISKANIFGDITYIFPKDTRRCGVFRHIEFGQTVLNRLDELEFDCYQDSICIVGTMVSMSISLVAIAQAYEEFNVLLFNSSDDMYVQKKFHKNDWIR